MLTSLLGKLPSGAMLSIMVAAGFFFAGVQWQKKNEAERLASSISSVVQKYSSFEASQRDVLDAIRDMQDSDVCVNVPAVKYAADRMPKPRYPTYP